MLPCNFHILTNELIRQGISFNINNLNDLLDTPNPNHCLSQNQIDELPEHIVALIIRDDTYPIIVHAEFPFSVAELATMDADIYDALQNDVVIDALLNGVISTYEEVYRLLVSLESPADVSVPETSQVYLKNSP